MRSIKLTAAIAAAAALLTLAAAGASARPLAHKHAGASGNCRIELFAEPHLITSGETVAVFGQLRCGAGSNEGQAVTVYGRSGDSPALTILGTPTTGAGGFYSLEQKDVTSDSFYYASALGVHSATRVVRVEPVVTLGGPPETLTLFTGFRDRVTFTGTVSPADAGAQMVLQRENATSNEEWHPIQLGVVGPGGVYAFTHRFVRPGDANIRVLVRRHGELTVRGVSNTLSYGISQRENPGLTINTEPSYSIPYGSPITLSGILASGAGTTVTLQARTRGNEFATVTTAPTGAGGAYKFVTTPLQNTAYRVTAGVVKSAVLFEGVKYILTAGISATTIQAGQPLTFEGTVTPGTEGKTVYLERENNLGGDFHVVDVATVIPGKTHSEPGTYSITDHIFGAGKAVFRVKVPGDPDNQQTSSAPFTVEVTPASPGALKPAAQPKGPSEGTV
jgi:hypothetical protein